MKLIDGNRLKGHIAYLARIATVRSRTEETEGYRKVLSAIKEMREHPIMADWKRLKHSVLETANNNGSEGNEDVYRILTWVAQMMDNCEKRWPKSEAD